MKKIKYLLGVLFLIGWLGMHYLKNKKKENHDTPRVEHLESSSNSQTSDPYNSTDNYDWMQGTWTINVNMMGKTRLLKLVIDGNNGTLYSDGEVLEKGKYEIYDGKIHLGSTPIDFDEERQLIKADNNHYFNHSSQPTMTINAESPQDKEFMILGRLHELGERGQSLVSELSAMRQRGQVDPARYIYIKQTVIQYKDEQIRLSQELGDEQMVREYMQQKNKVLQAFSMIENGY